MAKIRKSAQLFRIAKNVYSIVDITGMDLNMDTSFFVPPQTRW